MELQSLFYIFGIVFIVTWLIFLIFAFILIYIIFKRVRATFDKADQLSQKIEDSASKFGGTLITMLIALVPLIPLLRKFVFSRFKK